MKKFPIIVSGIIISIVSIIALLFSLLVIILIYTSINAAEYTDNIVKENGYEYNLSNYRKQCAFSIDNDYLLEGTNVTIDIPDTYNGYKVVRVGKEYSNKGCGMWSDFCYTFPFDTPEVDWHTRLTEDELPDNAEILTYNLTINLGKHVKRIYAHIYSTNDYLKVKGENKYIRINVHINCPEDNKYFYSKDGVLYNKSDDTPVDIFYEK